MKISAKTYVTILLVIALSVSALLFPITAENYYANAQTATALTYEYVMSAPIAVTADGDKLFVITNAGQIVSVSDGMEIVSETTATDFAISNGKTVTPLHGGFVFAGQVSGEITSTAIYLYDNGETVLANADNGSTFLCGTIYDDKIYVAVNKGDRTSLYAYSVTDGTRQLVKYELKSDGNFTAMVAHKTADSASIYYATDYSLYEVGKSGSYDVGGITSLAHDGTDLYYTTRSGKLCKFADGLGQTVFSASEKISVSSRKNYVAFANKGNDRVTVMDDNGTYHFSVPSPSGVAIGYDGSLFVSSENAIYSYDGKNGVLKDEFKFDGAYEYFSEIKVDLSDVSGSTVYAITDSGKLVRSSDTASLMGVACVEITPLGEIFIMATDGSVAKYDDTLSVKNDVLTAGNYTDMVVDNAGNVYRLSSDGVYKNADTSPVYSAENLSEIALSYAEIADNGSVGYGDVIAVNNKLCASTVIARSSIGTNMMDDPNADEYKTFVSGITGESANGASYALDVRRAKNHAEIYDVPMELPSATSVALTQNSYVIVLGKYKETDYLYVIAEAPKSSVYGFVNKNMLSNLLPLEKVEDESNCTAVSIANIYKYPSLSAPIISQTKVGGYYPIKDFVSAYSDANGQSWRRIEYTDGGVTCDGYVLRSNVAIGGVVGGEYKDIVTDAEIKCDTEFVLTYFEPNENSVLGQIKNGTKIQLEEPFKKGNEFTKITYIINEETGATTTCYVKTEHVKHTEAGSYQLVMFIVAGVIIASVIILIIVAVKRKRKIN